MPIPFAGTGLLIAVAYVVFIVYCLLRFLSAIDRGVAAHERIAQELGRLGGQGGAGSGSRGT